MPPIFKPLATIMAWVLWIAAIVMGIGTFIGGTIRGEIFSNEIPLPVELSIAWAVACFYGIAAVVVMILRKKME